MNRNYIVLIIIALGLATGILFMDKTNYTVETSPENLFVKWNDPSRFLTVDEVAHRLIQQDPGILLIDVRPADQYNAFSLPGSINIPFDSLLTENALAILESPGMDKVLYSNSELWAEQAWLISERLRLSNIFILEGGLNNWFNTIIAVKEPGMTAPQEEIDRYSFHLAANQHFYGKTTESKEVTLPKRSINVSRNKPSFESGGGC